MATTKEQIREWIQRGLDAKKRTTHMLIVCDTFDWSDYPVYVTEDQICQEVFEDYSGKNMQKVMEIYNLETDLDEQVNATRAWHT